MKTKKTLFYLLTGLTALSLLFSSCKDDKDDVIEEPIIELPPVVSETGRVYPAGSIVWKKDTVITLTNHFIVPVNTSLFVEEGAQIIMDNIDVRPEIVVLGNIYCYGTQAKPIRFTVPTSRRTEVNKFDRTWGGIICGYDSKEALLVNTIIEYGGAQTTEQSASFQNQLFKTVTGEGVPAFHFCNTAGSFVIKNCTFRNNAEDQVYITGGKSIVENNKFICSGFDGGEAINYKSGCVADVAYNLIYDANSNALKLSNNGALDPQTHLYAYNNSLINCGWRRPKVKGGSIWLEIGIYAELYNNLIADCRWACKQDVANPQDARSVITPNYYFASTATGVTQYGANSTKGQLVGASDIVSASAGDKNPLFKNFTIQSNVDINAGTTLSGNVPQSYNDSWDFHLTTGSPALTGGNITFARHFGSAGIRIDGIVYTSAAPSAFFGAYGL